jgi:hypothetical protein
MPISYDGKYIVPAPFLGINKTYIRTSDGQKVGATYSITLDGTLIPHKGSPDSKGNLYESENISPDDENDISVSILQHAFMKKTEAIRDLFSTDGKLLEISSWLENSGGSAVYPAISGYPRITSIDFPSNQYVQTMPYSITLELDELVGIQDTTSRGEEEYGREDFYGSNARAPHESGEHFTEPGTATAVLPNLPKPIYLASADENWNIQYAGNKKGELIPHANPIDPDTCENASHGIAHRETAVYSVDHTVTAGGKNAYDGSGLIRKPWQNAKMWVDGQVGLPSSNSPSYGTNFEDIFGDGTGPSGDYDQYRFFNHIRQKNADYSNGTFSVTESWVMVRDDGTGDNYDVFDDCSVNMSYDRNTGLSSVSVAGNITGLETRDSCTLGNRTDAHYDNVTTSAFNAAKLYYDDVYNPSLTGTSTQLHERPGSHTFSIFEYAKKCFDEQYIDGTYEDSLGTTLKPQHISKTINQNVGNGSIAYSFVFNNRPQFVLFSKTETYTASDKKAVGKWAILEVPGRFAGPVFQNMSTKEVAQVTITADILMSTQKNFARPSWSGEDVNNANITNKPLITDGIALGARRIALPSYHPCHPNNSDNVLLIVSDQQESFDPTSGKYSLTTTYTYQEGCTTVQFG